MGCRGAGPGEVTTRVEILSKRNSRVFDFFYHISFFDFFFSFFDLKNKDFVFSVSAVLKYLSNDDTKPQNEKSYFQYVFHASIVLRY